MKNQDYRRKLRNRKRKYEKQMMRKSNETMQQLMKQYETITELVNTMTNRIIEPKNDQYYLGFKMSSY